MTTTVNKEPGERVLKLGKKGQTMELEVPLPPEHMHALERQIADKSSEAFRHEAELELKKAEVLNPIKAKIKQVKEEEQALVDRRNRGVMLARVDVETRAEVFRREKFIVRLDTGEEVPNTRKALTDEDLQLLMPDVVKEGGPDADVLPLFGPKAESASAAEEKPWQQSLPAPYTDWALSESKTESGERLYMVTRGPLDNPSRAWGPFGFSEKDGLYAPGNPGGGLGTDASILLAQTLGLEDANVDGTMVPAVESESFSKFLALLNETISARADALASPTEEAPEDGLNLYEASGHAGWAGYVHRGQFFLRPPSLDRFEGPASPKDKGPLEWDAKEKRLDGARGANVSSEWLDENERLLAEFDLMIRGNKVKEPINELAPLAGREPAVREENGVEAEETGTDEDAPEEQEPSSAEGGPDIPKMAAKLTDNGRKLLKALATHGPNPSARLGVMTGCGKPGSALKHLARDGMVSVRPPGPGESAEIWDITDLGRQVHEQATK